MFEAFHGKEGVARIVATMLDLAYAAVYFGDQYRGIYKVAK